MVHVCVHKCPCFHWAINYGWKDWPIIVGPMAHDTRRQIYYAYTNALITVYCEALSRKKLLWIGHWACSLHYDWFVGVINVHFNLERSLYSGCAKQITNKMFPYSLRLRELFFWWARNPCRHSFRHWFFPTFAKQLHNMVVILFKLACSEWSGYLLGLDQCKIADILKKCSMAVIRFWLLSCAGWFAPTLCGSVCNKRLHCSRAAFGCADCLPSDVIRVIGKL